MSTGVGLAVAAEPGEVREGTVRPEHVVGVVAADLEPAGTMSRSPAKASLTAARRCAAYGAAGDGPVTVGRRGAQSSATNARNSSVVGRARFSACFCSSLVTGPWSHGRYAACSPPHGDRSARLTARLARPQRPPRDRSAGAAGRRERPGGLRLGAEVGCAGAAPAERSSDIVCDSRSARTRSR